MTTSTLHTIDIESISRLDVQSGETLVIVLPDDMNEREFARTAELLKDAASLKDIKLLVVNSRVDLTVADTRSLEKVRLPSDGESGGA